MKNPLGHRVKQPPEQKEKLIFRPTCAFLCNQSNRLSNCEPSILSMMNLPEVILEIREKIFLNS